VYTKYRDRNNQLKTVKCEIKVCSIQEKSFVGEEIFFIRKNDKYFYNVRVNSSPFIYYIINEYNFKLLPVLTKKAL